MLLDIKLLLFDCVVRMKCQEISQKSSKYLWGPFGPQQSKLVVYIFRHRFAQLGQLGYKNDYTIQYVVQTFKINLQIVLNHRDCY